MNLTRPQQLIYDSEKIIGGSISVMCGILTVDKLYPEAEVIEAIQKIYETNDALNYKLDDSGPKPQMYYEKPVGRKINIVRVNQLSDLDEIGREVVTTPFLAAFTTSSLSPANPIPQTFPSASYTGV